METILPFLRLVGIESTEEERKKGTFVFGYMKGKDKRQKAVKVKSCRHLLYILNKI